MKYKLILSVILFFAYFFRFNGNVSAQVFCGNVYAPGTDCPSQCPPVNFTPPGGQEMVCCGQIGPDGVCSHSVSECGGVYNPGTTCPNTCPGQSFTPPGGTEKICCGVINQDTGVCVASTTQKVCGDQYSQNEAINVVCACNSGQNLMSNGNMCCGYIVGGLCVAIPQTTFTCGQTLTPQESFTAECTCESGLNPMTTNQLCCGWVGYGSSNSQPICSATYIAPRPKGTCGSETTEDAICPMECSLNSTVKPGDVFFSYCCGNWDNGQCTYTPGVTISPGVPNPVDGGFLAGIDPLQRGGKIALFLTPGAFISQLMPYLFVFAGLILFLMLVWGGFEMLSGAATPQSQEAGKQRITAAIIGFVLLFISYWVAQIVQIVFGITIL